MSQKIDLDHGRFRQIVRGKIKQNLRKYISQGEMIGAQGQGRGLDPAAADRHPALPLRRQAAGRRRARARATSATRSARARRKPGEGEAGERPGEHLARGRGHARRARRDPGRGARAARHRAQGHREDRRRTRIKYTGIRTSGPESLAPLPAHLSSRRSSARSRCGTYDPKNPVIVPDPRGQALPLVEDRARCRRRNAVIIYMMDVSGSMGDEQKEIVRIESLLDRYLAALAVQGPREPLHHPRRDGARGRSRHLLPHARVGRHDDLARRTSCARRSSRTTTRPSEWNIYPFHFSDGDNWSVDDTRTLRRAAQERRSCRSCNLFCYGQVESPLRLGPVHQGPARALRRATSASSPREIEDKDAHRGLDQGLPREGQVDAVSSSNAAARQYLRDMQETIEGHASDYGLDFFPILFEVLDYDR